MALTAVKSRSLADQIFEQLASEIVGGRYQPRDSLPAERALAEIFRVNRHVVREALKRLAQIGLIRIAQGGGTTVRNFTRSAGLDLLALMAESARAGRDVDDHWLAVHEMRAAITPDVARLCALRAEPALREELLAIAGEMPRAESSADLFALELRFWDRALDGAGNIAYRLAFNSLMRAINAVPEASRRFVRGELRASGYRTEIALAIARGDAETAEAVTRAALRSSAEHFARATRARQEKEKMAMGDGA